MNKPDINQQHQWTGEHLKEKGNTFNFVSLCAKEELRIASENLKIAQASYEKNSTITIGTPVSIKDGYFKATDEQKELMQAEWNRLGI